MRKAAGSNAENLGSLQFATSSNRILANGRPPLVKPFPLLFIGRTGTLGMVCGLSGKNPPAGLFTDPPGSRLQPDLVVDRLPQPLLTTEVAFRRFHGNVAQQELDLLQLSACHVAQARAGPTTIVGRELLNAGALCTGSHNVPDDLFGDAVAPNRALAAHARKDSPIPDACRLSKFVDCCLDPIGDRRSTDMPALVHQIDQSPVFLPLLDIAKLELGDLAPAQPHPRRMARIARSRRPFNVCSSGARNRLLH
jgi:hypothetical protein